MHFKIKAVPNCEEAVEKYYASHSTFHTGDSGLDLFCLTTQTIKANTMSNKIHLGIQVEAVNTSQNSSGFYLYPRSSTGSKTPLRLSNSVGIIDAGYRGELIALVDNMSDKDFTIQAGERYFQICAPTLESINFTLTNVLSETNRGEGGFGSTGK